MNFVKAVDRVAIAVGDLEQARSFFEKAFGARFDPVEDVEDMDP